MAAELRRVIWAHGFLSSRRSEKALGPNLASVDLSRSHVDSILSFGSIGVAVEVQGPSWCLSTSIFTSVYFTLLDYSETHRGNQQAKTSLSRYPYVSVGYYFDFQKLNAEARVKSGAGNVLRMSYLSLCNTMEAQHIDLKGRFQKSPPLFFGLTHSIPHRRFQEGSPLLKLFIISK